MVGKKTWQMEEVLHILGAHREDNKPFKEICELHNARFEGHKVETNAIRYVWDKYKIDPSYNQTFSIAEAALIMGRYHAGDIEADILKRFNVEFKGHKWEQHTSQISGIEFVVAKHRHDLDFTRECEPDEVKFVLLAKKNQKGFHDISRYFRAKFPTREMTFGRAIYVFWRHVIIPPMAGVPRSRENSDSNITHALPLGEVHRRRLSPKMRARIYRAAPESPVSMSPMPANYIVEAPSQGDIGAKGQLDNMWSQYESAAPSPIQSVRQSQIHMLTSRHLQYRQRPDIMPKPVPQSFQNRAMLTQGAGPGINSGSLTSPIPRAGYSVQSQCFQSLQPKEGSSSVAPLHTSTEQYLNLATDEQFNSFQRESANENFSFSPLPQPDSRIQGPASGKQGSTFQMNSSNNNFHFSVLPQSANPTQGPAAGNQSYSPEWDCGSDDFDFPPLPRPENPIRGLQGLSAISKKCAPEWTASQSSREYLSPSGKVGPSNLEISLPSASAYHITQKSQIDQQQKATDNFVAEQILQPGFLEHFSALPNNERYMMQQPSSSHHHDVPLPSIEVVQEQLALNASPTQSVFQAGHFRVPPSPQQGEPSQIWQQVPSTNSTEIEYLNVPLLSGEEWNPDDTGFALYQEGTLSGIPYPQSPIPACDPSALVACQSFQELLASDIPDETLRQAMETQSDSWANQSFQELPVEETDKPGSWADQYFKELPVEEEADESSLWADLISEEPPFREADEQGSWASQFLEGLPMEGIDELSVLQTLEATNSNNIPAQDLTMRELTWKIIGVDDFTQPSGSPVTSSLTYPQLDIGHEFGDGGMSGPYDLMAPWL